MLIYFKNSFLASVLSISGCMMVITAILTGIEEREIGGAIIFIVIGLLLYFWGKNVSENKAFKEWWKQVKDNNLESQIATSLDMAVAIYNKNPQKRTLAKIENLNPSAATYIKQNLASKK